MGWEAIALAERHEVLALLLSADRIAAPFHRLFLPKVYNYGAAEAQAQHAFQLVYSLQPQQSKFMVQSIKPASNCSGCSLYIYEDTLKIWGVA